MPAANIMAIHEEVRNSGASSAPPSLMVPNLEKATKRMKATKTVPKRMKAQPKFSSSPVRAVEARSAKDPGEARPQATTASAMSPAGRATAQSMPLGGSSSSTSGAWVSSGTGTAVPAAVATRRSASSLAALGAGASSPGSWVVSVVVWSGLWPSVMRTSRRRSARAAAGRDRRVTAVRPPGRQGRTGL